MLISHRINTLDASSAAVLFSSADGIEFDLRDSNGELIVQHDACSRNKFPESRTRETAASAGTEFQQRNGQLFSEFLTYCPTNKFYIVNIKAEGFEELAIQMLTDAGIHTFFLLDCGMPSIVRLGRKGERRMAVRFSEYESFETVIAVAPFVSWIWIDVFTRLTFTKEHATRAKELGLRLCLVSPELQGQPEKREEYLTFFKDTDIHLDAICTKQRYISN